MSYSEAEVERAIDSSAAMLGFPELREKQKEAIRSFVGGVDTFVSLPTGYGKSLCYSLLPFVYDFLRKRSNRSIVICVSPLTALMLDQRNKYTPRGLKTEIVREVEEDPDVLRKLEEGHYQLIYVSPEALLCGTQWRDMLHLPVYQKNLVAFTVDEAHCVKKW